MLTSRLVSKCLATIVKVEYTSLIDLGLMARLRWAKSVKLALPSIDNENIATQTTVAIITYRKDYPKEEGFINIEWG